MKTILRVLIIIIFLGTLLRMINLNQPLLEGASTRQVQTAMIARNFYNHGFNLFYPQIEGYGGDNPGYVMQEFYIIPFIAALFYKLLGGVHEWVLRLLSVFSYIMATIMIYKLASYYFNKKIGVISAFLFSISPLSIYLGRAVHPEMAMIFFNMSAIYFFSKWIDEGKFHYGFLAAFAFVFAVLLKVPNLYLLLPLTVIAYMRFGVGMFKMGRLWIFLIISSIPIILFNYHQYLVRMTFPNDSMDNFKIASALNNIKIYLFGNFAKTFYKKVYEDMMTYTLTPIGFTLFLIGLMLKPKEKRQYILYIWMGAVIIFFMIMPGQCMQGYYHMHFLPIACIFIAQFLYVLNEVHINRYMLFTKSFTVILFAVIALGIVTRYAVPYYKVPENFLYVVEAGKAVDRLTEKDALVLCSIENGPDLLYYSNRKGWPFMIDMKLERKLDEMRGLDTSNKSYDPIEVLEQLKKRGATYFVSASVGNEFLRDKDFSGYMFKNYKVLTKNSKFIIFDLKEKVR